MLTGSDPASPKPLATEQSFDAVELGGKHMNAAEFLALPLLVRVEHILSNNVRFSLRGEAVTSQVALSSMRTRRVEMS